MPKGRIRSLNLSGYDLYRHFYLMVNASGTFVPPRSYEAMKAAPPLQGPFLGPSPGQIVLPDSNLRKIMEEKSKQAQKLATYGFYGLPQYFETRYIDDAVAQVKDIMKENPAMTQTEAIDIWNEKMERRERVREREMAMLQHEAITRRDSPTKQGGESNILTLQDSMDLLKLLRDIQVEGGLQRKVDPEEVIQKVRSFNLQPKEYPGIPTDKVAAFNRQLDYIIKYKMKQQELEEVVKVKHKNFFNLELLKIQMLQTEKRLTPSFLLKIKPAFQLYKSFCDIVIAKAKQGRTEFHGALSKQELEQSVLEYKAQKPIDIYNEFVMAATKAIGEHEQELSLRSQYANFKTKFMEFVELEQVELNISGFLSKLNLGFQTHPFEDRGAYPHPLEGIIPRISLAPIVEKKPELKPYQARMEEFFLVLDTLQYLRKDFVQTLLAEGDDSGTADQLLENVEETESEESVSEYYQRQLRERGLKK